MENPQPPSQSEATGPSQMYWYIVAMLMLVVIGSLAYLWFAERNALVACQRDYQAEVDRLAKANKSMFDVLNMGTTGGAAPAQAEEKSAMEATVDGRWRGVIVIDEPVGRRLGFAGGDVIFVKRSPTTAATGP